MSAGKGFRLDDARATRAIIAGSLAVRLVTLVASCFTGPAWLPVIQLVGVLTYLRCWRRLPRSGFVMGFILTYGMEWLMWCAAMVSVFGVAPGFQLWGVLVLPMSVLLYPALPLRRRIGLLLTPFLLYPPFTVVLGSVPGAVALSPPTALWVGIVNGFALTAVALAIAIAAMLDLARARALAERHAAAQTRLVEDMSHELRTPLATVLTAIQGVDRPHQCCAEADQAMDWIEADTRFMSRLVGRMLELADLDGGRVQASLDTPLSRALTAPVDRGRHQALDRGVTLTVEGPEIATLTDPVSLDVVVSNLVSNAIHHSPKGGRVRVRTIASETGIVLEVEDEGDGIAPADLDRVFDRYWRADLARSRSAGRHGIGLALARRHAELLGAELGVRSTPGVGSVFSLRWPATDA